MQSILIQRYRQILPPERMFISAPLSSYSTMRVGGPADLLLEPINEEEIIAIFAVSAENGIPCCLIGNGSNLLFSDNGFRGVVIHLGKGFSQISVNGNIVFAQAGALLSQLAHVAAEQALTGLEFAAGIPGTVGGAVYMNAGAYGGEIAHCLTNARVLVNGCVEEVKNADLQFGYRNSAVMQQKTVVLSAEFQLEAGDPSAIHASMAELARRRKEKQPLSYPSCGSFFKRPAGYYAGALIEQAGLKGYSVGDAQVSELHAGFLINRGHATAMDVYRLMLAVQERVYQHSGVLLEPEVQLIGDFEA